MQLDTLIADIQAAATPDAVTAYVSDRIAPIGFNVLAIGEIPHAGSNRLRPFFHATWPDWWYEVYSEAGLVCDDPLVRLAACRTMPFTWSEILADIGRWQSEKSALRLFELFREFGWEDGFAVPVHGPSGYRGLASFAGRPRPLSGIDRAYLHLIGLYAHDRLLVFHRAGAAADIGDRGNGLTQKERFILECIAQGGSDRQIATALGLSERTVLHYVQCLKRKLGCRTREQAVAVALRGALIDP